MNPTGGFPAIRQGSAVIFLRYLGELKFGRVVETPPGVAAKMTAGENTEGGEVGRAVVKFR
jgi:hypothetical protein